MPLMQRITYGIRNKSRNLAMVEASLLLQHTNTGNILSDLPAVGGNEPSNNTSKQGLRSEADSNEEDGGC